MTIAQVMRRMLCAALLATVAAGVGLFAGADAARADGAAASLQINDLRIVEPWGTSTQASFTISLDAPAPVAVTVRARTFDGTALHGSSSPDYDAKDSVVTFAAGEQEKTFAVTVRGSGVDEPDEWFGVQLLEPSGATLADDTGVAWIDDADRDGWFVCRALPRTDPTMPQSYVERPTDCISQQHSSSTVPVGTIGTISAATTRETAEPSSPNVAPLAVGDGGRAEVTLGKLSLLAGTDTPITVAAVESSADARCRVLGALPALVGSSRVVGAKIGGLDLPDVIAGYQRYDLPNGLGTVEFNRQTVRTWTEGIRTYTVVRQDAIVLTLTHVVTVGSPPLGVSVGGTFTVGTSTAGHYGNPCVT
ncbi:Calx-beta domain-containing protein [Nocardioides panacisoli]|uniref:Calx-beta domain-containing protein n=1 Tax=Nocardioides panacisoli TaxID=627624 RepID=A0ABP7IYJ2_9ACTN